MTSITKDGAFDRKPTDFHNKIPSAEFPVEKDRYHLYVCLACPWANRALIARELYGLQDVISVSYVHYLLGQEGWKFDDPKNPDPEQKPLAKDDVNGFSLLRQVYELSVGDKYDGKITVPVLFDKKTKKIVNNESAELLHIFNGELKKLGTNPDLELYPDDLAKAIEEANEWVYPLINNGVYKAGFARADKPYREAVKGVFEGLDRAEEILSRQRYIAGDRFTQADIRLFTTLVRFDSVYSVHFKCSAKRIVDYPNLFNYTKEIYQMPGVANTVDVDQIAKHYYQSHTSINPLGLVPLYADHDFSAKHDREEKFPTVAK
jgi:putative glutathione S-transferase